MTLQGKTALITGAASEMGLGFATARMMARAGARVMITDIAADAVAARAEELRAEGHDVAALPQDVTDAAGWDKVVATTVERFGGLDILVNNAGIAVLKWMDALEPADWQRQIDVNLSSVYLGCRAALKQMRVQGRGGSIVNLSSVAGLVGIPGAAAYAASKGGVRIMTKAIAMECAKENIRVNSVQPGVIWTDMQQVAIKDNPEQYDAINAAIPMGRMGEPDDIAAMIAFLASDASKYVTGGEFTVDGGLTAQ
ncbi:SDR family NAD(P)-dependent oxidoreductase [Rhizorhabdus sp. FW153]|uniref:SDR family NAD(P)-dependent oxidoreductase n=1 Tax=Rhizorhabdus sp. FW153 TaxID=3400216 RepID=UPI003CEDC239